MFSLRRLKIQGFRGFRGPVEFRFEHPATLFFGENRSGKSSALNAVEWCIFGDECLGKQTGIRERIGWVVANRHQPTSEARVEVELANATTNLTVQRCMRNSGRKGASAELHLVLPDGECLAGDAAQQRLTQLVGCQFRDFMTTVYQHQEAIRAILTQEPRDRNDAIDRLLGLAAYRNLQDSLQRVKAAERQRTMRIQFEAFERQVQSAVMSRARDLEELRLEAATAGVPVPEQNARAALTRAAQIAQSLDTYAQESGLAHQGLTLPNEWRDLMDFEAAAKQVIIRLRSEMPGIVEQQELFRRREALLQVKTALESVRGRRSEFECAVQELDRLYGSQAALAGRLEVTRRSIGEAKERLRHANRRAALVREALTYLADDGGGTPSDACPLCGQGAPALAETLRRQWDQMLQAQIAGFNHEIHDLTQRADELAAAAARYRKLEQQRAQLNGEITHCQNQASECLEKTLTADDDAVALVTGALEAIAKRGTQLRGLIESKQKRLAAIEQELHRLRMVHHVLACDDKNRLLEAIQEAPAYKDLEALRDSIANWVADVEAIQQAITAVAHAEAAAALESAEQTIDGYFHALTHHPAIAHLKLRLGEARNQRNCYEITDQDGTDLTPILSQGDLNCLALAMFLGLAAASAHGGALDLIMLDDPSQSLGSEHKQHLVQVLNDVARHKRILLATMDRELRDLFADNLTRTKTEFAFGRWSPENGPSIQV